jgi:hypothetical protein
MIKATVHKALHDLIRKHWQLDDRFILEDVYRLWFEGQDALPKSKKSESKKAVARKGLQRLRDKGYIEFIGRGKYRRIK